MPDALDDPLRRVIAAETTAPELRQLADLLADYRLRLDEAEDLAKRIRGDYEQKEAELFDALENAGLRQIRTARGLFSTNDLAWASIEDVEKARQWAEQTMPELLTLNLQRLSKIIRDHLRGEGDLAELPEGVTYKTSRKITWRRS